LRGCEALRRYFCYFEDYIFSDFYDGLVLTHILSLELNKTSDI